MRSDGTPFWANVVITALRDGQGKHIGFAQVTRDLSERRRGEEALRQSEERFRLLVDNVTDHAIYMLDASGKIVTWNSGAERIKGYRATEIVGKHVSSFFPDEDAAAAHQMLRERAARRSPRGRGGPHPQGRRPLLGERRRHGAPRPERARPRVRGRDAGSHPPAHGGRRAHPPRSGAGGEPG